MEELDEDSDSIGVTDDIDPSAPSFDMTDILDGDQNSEESLNTSSKGVPKGLHSLHDRTSGSPASPSSVVGGGKSLDTTLLTSSSGGSKPIWSMDAYLASTNSLNKTNSGRHNSFSTSYSQSLMHSAYPFIPRSSTAASLPEVRGHSASSTSGSHHPQHHPAILNTILNNVPDNYHFRQSLLSGYVPGATSGPTPGSDLSSGKGVPGAPTGNSLADFMMWTMAARNAALGGTSGLSSSLSPYNLLSWSAQAPSQNTSRSLLPSQPPSSSHFDSDEFRKALILNSSLLPSRSQADFFSSPDFSFLPPFRPLIDSPSSFEAEKSSPVKRQKVLDEGAKRMKTSSSRSESVDHCKNNNDDDEERNSGRGSGESIKESHKSHTEKLNDSVEQ